MDEAEAIHLAEEHFPKGPEVIAERLGAEVRQKPINLDGWCLRKSAGGAIITLNANSPETRRRFTLAHEVAHLILGTQSDVQGRVEDIYDPRSKEERAANRLGAELLLPTARLKQVMRQPVDSRAIRSAAKAANVSEVVVALRLFKQAEEFDLKSPVVARLEESVVKWHMPITYPLSDRVAWPLYLQAQQQGGTSRTHDRGGSTILVCALSNPSFPVLFMYWLSPQQESALTPWEKRKELEAALFSTDSDFRVMINAFIGAFKPRVADMTLDEAVEGFYQRYGERLKGEQDDKLHSATCQEYIRLRLSEYAKSS